MQYTKSLFVQKNKPPCGFVAICGVKRPIAPTESGYTAEVISKYRPKAAIVAYTPDERAVRQLNLRWGVYPILGSQWSDVNEMTSGATSAAVKHDYVKRGDCTIITSGIKTSEGNTNSIRIYTI
jgi:pyruvate kinase